MLHNNLNDTSSNLNKGKSGRRVTDRTAENIQAVQEALEVSMVIWVLWETVVVFFKHFRSVELQKGPSLVSL